MADINIKTRVKALIEGKPYDLRPSGNPHQKLPKAVVTYLKDNDLLADSVPVVSSGQSSDAARMQAEIDRLTTALASAEGERDEALAELQKASEALSAAEAEIDRLKKA